MQVDEESSDESEEEVCILLLFWSSSLIFTGQQGEEFYTPGSLELLEALRRLAEYSLPRLESIYP